jgi:hypothetical protein
MSVRLDLYNFYFYEDQRRYSEQQWMIQDKAKSDNRYERANALEIELDSYLLNI